MPGVPNSRPSSSKRARSLDPDLNPWDKQPEESQQAYATFLEYRDSESRKVGDHGSANVYNWSSEWSWGYRVYEWDKYLARVDQQEMVRYRRQMNERQRLAGRSAQQKIVHWLLNLDVSRLTPTEAARWWEVAVRVERQAAGADLPMSDLPEMPPEDTPDEYAGLTLGDVLNGTHTPDEVLDLAENIHRAIDS